MTQLSLEGIVNSSAKAAAQKLADLVDNYESKSKRKWGGRPLDTLRIDYQNRLYLHLAFSYTEMYYDDTALGEFACFVGRHENVIPHLPRHHPSYWKDDARFQNRLLMASVAAGAIVGTAVGTDSNIGGYAPLFGLYMGVATTVISFNGINAAIFIGNSIGLLSRFKDPFTYINEIRSFVDEEIHLRDDQEVMSKKDV